MIGDNFMTNNNVIYQEIINNFKLNELYHKIKDKKLHLGIFAEPYLSLMINGEKTIESRFSKNKTAPYNQITKDDIIIVKKSGGNVIGFIEIDKVLFYDLTKTSINNIKDQYAKELCVDQAFWDSKASSHYATLIFIKQFTLIKPFPITKKGMQTWIVLQK
jgi:ASC-1-like (ASCH) protein